MKTPAINTKIINTIPVLLSGTLSASVLYYYGWIHYFSAIMLGIIAGGLVDLDNGLTGKLKNIVFALLAFSISSLSVQSTFNHPVLLAITFAMIGFIFTMLGAAGTRFRTISFGTLAVAVYTTLTHDPKAPIFLNSFLIIIGASLYSGFTLLTHLVFPHRPVQENMANAYDALANYLEAKAEFFDPDEAEQLENQQITLAMTNSKVIETFNVVRNALFYRMRGQHRHPLTVKMLRYYFVAQDIHERISSAHMNYQLFVRQMQHTDLLFRIRRLIRLQAQAARSFAKSLRNNTEYTHLPKLARAEKGVADSLDYYAAHDDGKGASPYSVQRLLDNISRISQQFAHLGDAEISQHLSQNNERSRIQTSETQGFKNAWRILKQHGTLKSPFFRHAVRMAVIALSCCTIVQLIAQWHLNDSDLSMGYWILLTAVFVCQPNFSATKSKLLHRILGTSLGVLMGALIAALNLSLGMRYIVSTVALTLFFFSRTNKYSYSTFFITIQAMMGFSIMGFDVAGFFVPRMIDTLIGAAVSGIAVYCLWPDWKYISLDSTSAKAIQSCAGYLKAVLDELKNGSISDDAPYRLARRTSHDQAAALSSVLSDMSVNPDKHSNQLKNGFSLLKIDYSLISYISALGAYRDKIHANSETEEAFLHDFYLAAEQMVAILSNISTWDEKTFQAACDILNQQLVVLQPLSEQGEQNPVLYRQLVMMNELLPLCREALQAKNLK